MVKQGLVLYLGGGYRAGSAHYGSTRYDSLRYRAESLARLGSARLKALASSLARELTRLKSDQIITC
jgi:hypothetical protein